MTENCDIEAWWTSNILVFRKMDQSDRSASLVTLQTPLHCRRSLQTRPFSSLKPFVYDGFSCSRSFAVGKNISNFVASNCITGFPRCFSLFIPRDARGLEVRGSRSPSGPQSAGFAESAWFAKFAGFAGWEVRVVSGGPRGFGPRGLSAGFARSLWGSRGLRGLRGRAVWSASLGGQPGIINAISGNIIITIIVIIVIITGIIAIRIIMAVIIFTTFIKAFIIIIIGLSVIRIIIAVSWSFSSLSWR